MDGEIQRESALMDGEIQRKSARNGWGNSA